MKILYFKVVSGPMKGQHHVIKCASSFCIGRSERLTLSLPDDSYISRIHAKVQIKEDAITIEDLKSTNGIVLNGDTLVKQGDLRQGSLIQVGQTVLELSSIK